MTALNLYLVSLTVFQKLEAENLRSKISVAPAANEPGFVVQAEIFQLTIDAEVSPAAEIEEVIWVDPATDPALELAPLTRDLILPFYRASLTQIA